MMIPFHLSFLFFTNTFRLFLITSFIFLSSCTKFFFENPQPAGEDNLSSFPKKLIGTYVDIEKGDTLVTSGFSAVFPEGIMIGTISNFDLNEGNNFYNIEVQLSTDFLSLNHVYVISNLYKEEQSNLEKSATND